MNFILLHYAMRDSCLPLCDVFLFAERCTRINAKLPSESSVRSLFSKFKNSLQKTTNDPKDFPVFFSGGILILLSNCRNLRSASPSFSKVRYTNTVKSVLRLAKHPHNFTPRFNCHESTFHTQNAAE